MKHYRLIAKLPAVFPDGTPFDERLFPWMFNTWVKVLPKTEVPGQSGRHLDVWHRCLSRLDAGPDLASHIYGPLRSQPKLYAIPISILAYPFNLDLGLLPVGNPGGKIFRVRLDYSKAFRLLWGFVVFVSSAYLIVIPEYNGKLINPSLSHSLLPRTLVDRTCLLVQTTGTPSTHWSASREPTSKELL